MRPVLRGEEPAAREPGRGLGGGDRDAMATLDARWLAEMTSRLYCATNVDGVKIGLLAKTTPVKLILTL
jgi:hypothetical protein